MNKTGAMVAQTRKAKKASDREAAYVALQAVLVSANFKKRNIYLRFMLHRIAKRLHETMKYRNDCASCVDLLFGINCFHLERQKRFFSFIRDPRSHHNSDILCTLLLNRKALAWNLSHTQAPSNWKHLSNKSIPVSPRRRSTWFLRSSSALFNLETVPLQPSKHQTCLRHEYITIPALLRRYDCRRLESQRFLIWNWAFSSCPKDHPPLPPVL